MFPLLVVLPSFLFSSKHYHHISLQIILAREELKFRSYHENNDHQKSFDCFAEKGRDLLLFQSCKNVTRR